MIKYEIVIMHQVPYVQTLPGLTEMARAGGGTAQWARQVLLGLGEGHGVGEYFHEVWLSRQLYISGSARP